MRRNCGYRTCCLRSRRPGDLHGNLSLWNLRPALSAQFFRTKCEDWNPLAFESKRNGPMCEPTPLRYARSRNKVGDGFEGTRGLFVSYSGFTDEGLHAFNAKRVILMNGMDVFQTLRRRISLDEIIAAKFRRGTEERRSLIEVSELFPQ